jgi:hypothetical protein
MVLAAAALLVTVVAVLGGVGVVPAAPSAAEGQESRKDPESSTTPVFDVADHERVLAGPSAPPDTGDATETGSATDSVEGESTLPPASGAGRRVVFSETEQRVWLVRRDGSVRRTYLVSGSIQDNLDPGTYAVYSRSRWAVGLDDSGVMEFFVRFAQGRRAAIGFHTIPTKLGVALQTRAQLGTPQSHGCIRQAKADAISLWKFAPEGTTVVVI